jgi:hypothetical protein
MLLFLAICMTGAAMSVGLMVCLSTGLVGTLVYAVISPVAVTIAWRRALAGLAFNDNGVRVRTTARTRVLPWEDIRRFVVDTADPDPMELFARLQYHKWDDASLYGIWILLRDGELVATPIRYGPLPTVRYGGINTSYPFASSSENLYPDQIQVVLDMLNGKLIEQIRRWPQDS